MHILELRSENFKRLKVVKITPEGNVVQITGANGEGKTSCLDSIWAALGGKDAVPDQPIRKGKASARIEVKIGNDSGVKYIVERTFTAKETYLKVTDADGAKHQKPQQILDGLMGAIGFDPLAFMRMEARKQFEMLRGIVKLDVDLDALDRKRAMIYEERTGLNRDLARAKATHDAIVVPDLPETEPNVSAITDKLAGVSEHNERVREAQRVFAFHADQVDLAISTVEIARAALLQSEESLAKAEDALAQSKEEAIPDLQDPAVFRSELESAQKIADGFRTQERKIEAFSHVTGFEREVKARTLAIETIDEKKAAALASAKMPVEGLGFEDGVVLFNSLPIAQASSAEQLRISAAIGAALNPKLRVVLCRDGSLLDSKSLKLLGEFAEANTLQVWIERVDESGEVGIVIEDGHVRGQEDLVAESEKQEGQTAEAPDEARTKRARELLDASLTALKDCKTIITADKLNATIRTKLANFPDMVEKEWKPAYAERVREIQA